VEVVECELARVLINDRSDQQIIVLREKGGARSFPIMVGIFEALALDRKLKNRRMPRPLTHDLVENVLRELGGTLRRVTVSDLRENTFFAVLEISVDGRTVCVDARPSDGIVLAVSAGVPIFVAKGVLDEAAVQSGDSFGIDEGPAPFSAPEEPEEE